MPKKLNVDFSKGATASGYFTRQNTAPEVAPDEAPKKSATKKKVGRPKKAASEKSTRKMITCYFEPSTIKKMEAFVKENHIGNRSDLIENAILDYMNKNS